MTLGALLSFRTMRLAAALAVAAFAIGCGEPSPEKNTIHPEGFSVEAFKAVQIGDRWDDVVASVGKPFSYVEIKVQPGTKRYFYSKPKDKTKRYAAYDIAADANGIVNDKSIIYLHDQ